MYWQQGVVAATRQATQRTCWKSQVDGWMRAFVRSCVRACVCARACMRMRMCMRACICVRACVRVWIRAYARACVRACMCAKTQSGFMVHVFSFFCAEKKISLLVRVDCIGGHTCIALMVSHATLDRRPCHRRVVRIAGVGVLWVVNTCGLIGMSVRVLKA